MNAQVPLVGPELTPAEQYYELLADYQRDKSESSLAAAYEWGRRALERGDDIPAIVELHHQALRLWCTVQGAASLETLVAGSRLLGETLAPYEMARRGVRDAIEALRRLNDSLEEEARRIARAVHEEAGQLSVLVHLSFAELTRQLPSGAGRAIQAVEATLVQVERQLRQLSHELRPSLLDDLGWIPAIEWLAQSVSARHRLPISVVIDAHRRLSPAKETALYRATQEALTNAVRHAAATLVIVTIGGSARSAELRVTDNGCGFDLATIAHRPGDRGLGLIGIRERLAAVGGHLRIETAPGRGTVLALSVPAGEGDGSALGSR